MLRLIAEVTCRFAAAAVLLSLVGCPRDAARFGPATSLSLTPPLAREFKQALIYGGTSNLPYGVLVAVVDGKPVCKADPMKTVPLGVLQIKLEFGEKSSTDPIISVDFNLPQAAPTSMGENTAPLPVQLPPDKETQMTWQFHRRLGSLPPLSCPLTPMKPSALLVPEIGKTDGFLPSEKVPRGAYRLKYQHNEECKRFTAARSDGESLPELITLTNGGLSIKINCDGGESMISWTVEEEVPSASQSRPPRKPKVAPDKPSDQRQVRGCTYKTECDGHCTNLRSDPANCGECGNACPSSQVCKQGTCIPRSNGCTGKANCGGVCTNLQIDRAHCGVCGRACAPSQICKNGECAADGYDVSSVRCANTDDLSAAKNKQVGGVTIDDSLAQQTLTYPKTTIIKLPPTKMRCDLSVNGKPMILIQGACMTLAVPAMARIFYEGCR